MSVAAEWSEAKLLMGGAPVTLGPEMIRLFNEDPDLFLTWLNVYKFAAKMFHRGSVVELGCGAGLGAWIVAKECGACLGLEEDAALLGQAREVWSGGPAAFAAAGTGAKFDAALCLNAPAAEVAERMGAAAGLLKPKGRLVAALPAGEDGAAALRAALAERFAFSWLFEAGPNGVLIHADPRGPVIVGMGLNPF